MCLVDIGLFCCFVVRVLCVCVCACAATGELLVALGEAWETPGLVDCPCPTAPFKEVYKAHAGVGGDKAKFHGYVESHPAEFANCQTVHAWAVVSGGAAASGRVGC